MTSICIPYSNQSHNQVELKYSLRSLEKHLKDYGEVFIIGKQPQSFTGYTHIPHDDDPRSRYRDRNIMQKMVAACNDKRVSDNFLMWHDDHMLLLGIEASAFPYVHHGHMDPGPGQYGQTKQNTIGLFCGTNDLINDYDSHCPILFNKQLFLRSVPTLDWTKPYGYCLKTVYCIMNGIQAYHYPDLKIRYIKDAPDIRKAIAGRYWFSTGDRCFARTDIGAVLQELYPKKSIYER